MNVPYRLAAFTWFIVASLSLDSLAASQESECYYGDCENEYSIKKTASGKIFSGNYRDGKLEGYGFFIDKDGDQCAGEWVNNAMSGLVTCLYTSGTLMVNEHVKGRRNGQGISFNADGSIRQEGLWKNGKFVRRETTSLNADGGLRASSMGIFHGCLRGNCFNGDGIKVLPGNVLVRGTWVNGRLADNQTTSSVDKKTDLSSKKQLKPVTKSVVAGRQCLQGDCKNGYGVMVNSQGDKYLGNFVDGLYNGRGKMLYASGQIYAGEFVQGLRNGEGRWSGTTGAKYDGSWLNDIFHGLGTYTKSSGSKFVGQFVKGKKEGYGEEFFSNGKLIRAGYWGEDRYLGETLSNLNEGGTLAGGAGIEPEMDGENAGDDQSSSWEMVRMAQGGVIALMILFIFYLIYDHNRKRGSS